MYATTKERQFSPCYFEKTVPSSYQDDQPSYGIIRYKAKRIRSIKDKWDIRFEAPYINETEIKFSRLASQWKDETGFYSTTQQKVYNRNYLAIISLGERVLPYILRDLKNGGSWHWHTALSIITEFNPVTAEETNPRKIKEAWIKWGEHQNLI